MQMPTWPLQDPEILAALEAAWTDGSWGRYDGPHNERLVELLKTMHGVRFVLPCSSGTVAVELALRGLQLGENDEAILAGYDFSGNFRAIESIGAAACPCRYCSRNMVPRCESNCRCSCAANSCRDRFAFAWRINRHANVGRVAQQHGFAVLEDACQSPGARVQGRIAGSWGDVAVTSFGGSKLLTAGRGGALLTNREEIFHRAKIFAERGNNAFPLSELQAAVLPPQIRKLERYNQQRRANVERLLRQLADLEILRPVQNTLTDSSPVYYKVAFEYVQPAETNWPRQRLIAAFREAGVPVDEGFRGFTRRSSQRCRHAGTLTHSAVASESTILLHHPILLDTETSIDGLANSIRRIASVIR